MRRARATLVGATLGIASAALGTTSARAEEPVAAADFSAATERHAARIVLIGAAARDSELATLLAELLARQRVDATLARAERFDPDELFAARDGGILRVFVALKGPHEARLYFRAPEGERYLVRKLTLTSGLDAVGRELVGQVVASSAEALVDTVEGMTRDEASAVIAGEPADEPASSPAPTPSPPATRSDARPAQTTERRPFELHAAARYAAQWVGSDFGLRHGPALTAGLRYVDTALLFGGELGGEYGFEQSFSSAEADGQRREHQLYGLFEAGFELGRSGSVALAAGPRVELTDFRLSPKAAGVTAQNPRTEVRVGLRAELRYEWALTHVRFGACALVDVAFARTHYDLRDASGPPLELASVSLVRPGMAVWVGVR